MRIDAAERSIGSGRQRARRIRKTAASHLAHAALTSGSHATMGKGGSDAEDYGFTYSSAESGSVR